MTFVKEKKKITIICFAFCALYLFFDWFVLLIDIKVKPCWSSTVLQVFCNIVSFFFRFSKLQVFLPDCVKQRIDIDSKRRCCRSSNMVQGSYCTVIGRLISCGTELSCLKLKYWLGLEVWLKTFFSHSRMESI